MFKLTPFVFIWSIILSHFWFGNTGAVEEHFTCYQTDWTFETTATVLKNLEAVFKALKQAKKVLQFIFSRCSFLRWTQENPSCNLSRSGNRERMEKHKITFIIIVLCFITVHLGCTYHKFSWYIVWGPRHYEGGQSLVTSRCITRSQWKNARTISPLETWNLARILFSLHRWECNPCHPRHCVTG